MEADLRQREGPTRYVAFLRGINVSGRRVTGAVLREPFINLGFSEVATFLASGNVVFDVSEDAPAAVLEERIVERLAADLGFEVPTFLRTADQTARIAAHQPFPEDLVSASAGKPQVAMLAAEPAAGVRDDVLGLATSDDRLALDSRELYWLPSGGVSESQLDLAAIEEALGPMTMRTRSTVQRIAARYLSG